MKPRVIVTTSWDDGHTLDVRLAALLRKYGIKGTFYVSPRDQEFDRKQLLTDAEVKAISRDFEIGAHTMTHPRLPNVPDETARREIVDSKRYLERLLKKTVTTFCYPGGNYDAKHVDMVRQAGFSYARTVRRHSYNLKRSLLEGNTTINTYNHYQDLWKIAKFAKFNPFKTVYYFQWDNLAKAMFDKVLAEGGVYHLWGHSWEVDGHGDWEKLEAVLRYISGRKGVNYVTNGELPALQPKKLLIVAPYYPPHLGGVELYVYYIADYLRREHGWQVTVATTGGAGFRLQRTVEDGLTVYRLPYWLKLSNSPLHPWWPVWLRRIMKQEDTYVVNTQAPVPGLGDAGAYMARWLHLPLVVTYHMGGMAKGDSALDFLPKLYERYVLSLMLRPAASIICGSDMVQDFLSDYRDKTVVVTPGVDTDAFRPASKLAADRILYVGSVLKSDSHKGIAYLLEAMRTVIEAMPRTKLVLVGPGDGPVSFGALARDYGIASHVTFAGPKFGSEKQGYFRRSTVLALPSLVENFPLVVLEAMGSGLPVVASRVGSLPLMVDDGQTGYLVPPGDSQALAEQLIAVLRRPDTAKRLGAAARRKAERGLSWRSRAATTNSVLLAAMSDLPEVAP